METIGPWTFSKQDNLPFWQKGFDYDLVMIKNTAKLRKIPRSSTADFGGVRIYRRNWLESVPGLNFPEDCKKGELNFQIKVRRRPNMYPKMEPLITCLEAPDLPAVKTSCRMKQKSEQDKGCQKFVYFEENYRYRINIALLYKHLGTFLNNERLKRKEEYDHGRIHFLLFFRITATNQSFNAQEIEDIYFLPSFHERMNKFLTGKTPKQKNLS